MAKLRDGKFYVILTFEIPPVGLKEPEGVLFQKDCILTQGHFHKMGVMHSIVKHPIKSNCLILSYTFLYIVAFSELQNNRILYVVS